MTTATATETTRIWLGDLSAYNAGKLIGEWVDISDVEALEAAETKYGHGGQSDTYIGDVEGPAWVRRAIGEYCSVDRITDIAELLEAVEDESEAFDAWVECKADWRIDDLLKGKSDIADVEESFRDEYRGNYSSAEDFALSMFYDTQDPVALEAAEQWPFTCIDWGHAARELMYDYSSAWVDGRLYVFADY